MKTLKLACVSLFLLAGAFAASCSSDPETEAADRVEIDGLDDNLRFSYAPAADETFSFSISSNKTWSIAKSDLAWLTVSQMNGGSKLPATVTLSATANDDLERSGRLTIYAGADVRTVTVTQDAFPIVPTITLDGLTDNTLAFEFTDIEPVTFTLYSNVAWTADKQQLDWAEVTPLSGERKQEATITVTPTANGDDARQGTITFRAEGATPVVVTVTQTAYRDEPILSVTGAEDNKLSFAAIPEASASLQLLSNRNWTIQKSDLEWLTVSPESGSGSVDATEISLTAQTNTGKKRSGTLTVHSDDPALADIVITVTQEAKANTLLAWWTLTDDALKQYSGTDWTESGLMHADLPAGTTASGQWHKVSTSPEYDTTYIISGDGNGHYAVKRIWTDDNLEFAIPVKNFAAGSGINIHYGMSATNAMARYWSVEYFDAGVWKPTSQKTFTAPDGSFVKATYELTAQNLVVNVDETATFTEAVADGNLRIRIRCAAGAYSVQNKTLTKPNTSATIRIRQWSSGDNDAISFYLITQ